MGDIFFCLLIGIILNFLLDDYVILTIEIHSISFFLVYGIVYREKLYDAMVAYSVCYYVCFTYSITKDILFGEEIRITYESAIAVRVRCINIQKVNSVYS